MTLLDIFWVKKNTKRQTSQTDIRLVCTLQRCSVTPLMTDEQQAENLLTSVYLKVCPSPFWFCPAGMGWTARAQGPRAAACDGSQRRDLQTSAGNSGLVGCGRSEVGCLAGQHFNRHLRLSPHAISFPLFWFSGEWLQGERERMAGMRRWGEKGGVAKIRDTWNVGSS